MIELVDWAKLVSSYYDQKEMNTVEGRVRLLIHSLNEDHGLLYR